MEISIKWNVCRVCLQEESGSGPQMRHIFNDTKLPKQIFECAGVQVEPNDSLPDKICKGCLTILRYAVSFRSTCRNSDAYLLNVIQKAKSATSLFKLEKRQEEAQEFAEDSYDDMDETLQDDEVEEQESAVYNNEVKRKRTPTESSSEPLSETKKSKVDKILPTVPQLAEKEDPDSAKEELNATGTTQKCENKIVEKFDTDSTDKLLQDLDGEEDKRMETLPRKKVGDELPTTTNQFVESMKKESTTQVSSECTIIEVSVSEESEEEATSATEQKLQPQQQDDSLTASTEEYVEPNTTDENEHIIYDDNEQCILPTPDNDREFFYIISNDIKREFIEDEDGNSDENFIELDDEPQPETDVHAAGDTIEYLLDSTDEQSQAALDEPDPEAGGDQRTPTVNAKSKEVRLKRKAKGEVRVYVCDICGNHFSNRSLLNYHMKMHRNEKNFECELCFKRFNAACNLSAHMRVHTGEKPFVCQFCDRRFSDRSTHIKHERIHTNEKPYGCTICGKSFSLSTTLKAHEKIHTGEKPYSCEPCSKSFKLPHQLKAHLKTHLHKLLTVEK